MKQFGVWALVAPVVLLMLIGCGNEGPQASAASTDAAPIEPIQVAYHTNAAGKGVQGWLAKPASAEGKRPAVILIHEWWGLNDDIRRVTADYAAQGYVALAVDLYEGQAATTESDKARVMATAVRSNLEPAFANLRSAVAYLKKQPDVDGSRLASVGWCFGGGWSYQMAKNNLGVKASVIYYGQFNPQDDLKLMRAKILGHFAEKDRLIKVDDVKAFQARLKTLDGAHEIYIYPNTTHGFASRKGANPKYDVVEAKRAWERTMAFLKAIL